ncbi:MAG TPA: S41 family peptidase [Kofleriaceae bacterium]|nr:S41 family peptidase [Kofleriaceae bacterium]
MNRAGALLWLSVVVACGGDDSNTVPTKILPQSVYAQRCVTPRTGTDPVSGDKYVDQQGTLLDEQLWLRSWTDDLYLWYNEVPANNPLDYGNPLDYFDVLRTPVATTSGAPKDKFHFTYDTTIWENLSDAGTEASYGINWALVAPAPPRKLLVAFVDPGSPGDSAGFKRGTEVVTIDGVDVQNGADTDKLNNGISPASVGESHTFVIKDPGATTTHTVTVASAAIDVNPVPAQDVKLLGLPQPDDKIGYLLFTDHVATAEKGLLDAITQLKAAGATDLILDIRYNGGGFLDIASQLAYMIAGPDAAGKTFEKETFNDKHPTTDPVTGQPLVPTTFPTATFGFSTTAGTPLPTLDLPIKRVFVLTTADTCSASEAVMNGLAGVGVEVIQIGDTTCGKPYGFYPDDNCGTTYFSIQFKGENAAGFGDYSDGFVPGQTFKGCAVADDFTHQLSDPAEKLTAAAVYYRDHNACPPGAAQAAPVVARDRAALSRAGALALPKPLWLQNRIARRPIAR